MSKSNTEPNSDNAEKAAKDLLEKGFLNHEVVVSKRNEIMLDYDRPEVPDQFYKIYDILQTQRFSGGVYFNRFTSKGGNCHIIVTLPSEIEDTERIAWQAALGSDPLRESLSLVSVARNVKNPVLLFMHKERESIPETYKRPGRKFRND